MKFIKQLLRNIERFPEEFCFQLNKNEYENMWCQIVTTSNSDNEKYRNKKNLPYVYTEQGIAMIPMFCNI